jgi:uncharacterized protein (TIGR02996 family)
MTDRDTFLRAIIADPADDTARLVFADWLEENGEPARGEFIRTEVLLARRDPDDEAAEARRPPLFARRDELLKAHKREWLEPFLGYARESSFERGFVQEVEVPAEAFLTHGERWMALTPLTRVKFTDFQFRGDGRPEPPRLTDDLFASPLLSRLEKIDLAQTRVTDDDIELLARHPDLSRLRELVLRYNGLGPDGAITLAGMEQLQGLESLDLVGNVIGDRGARAIAQSAHLGGLRELRIGHNSIHQRSWAMLEDRFGPALMG